MELRIQSISDRLECVAEDPTELELTQLSELEVMFHLMDIDACLGRRLTEELMNRCRERIIDFAPEQKNSTGVASHAPAAGRAALTLAITGFCHPLGYDSWGVLDFCHANV